MAKKKAKLRRGRPTGENQRNARGLTHKQHQTLRYIKRCVIPPTVNDIAEFLGLGYRSSGQAVRDVLYEMGMVEYNDRLARSIRLTKLGREAADEAWHKVNPHSTI